METLIQRYISILHDAFLDQSRPAVFERGDWSISTHKQQLYKVRKFLVANPSRIPEQYRSLEFISFLSAVRFRSDEISKVFVGLSIPTEILTPAPYSAFYNDLLSPPTYDQLVHLVFCHEHDLIKCPTRFPRPDESTFLSLTALINQQSNVVMQPSETHIEIF